MNVPYFKANTTYKGGRHGRRALKAQKGAAPKDRYDP